MPGIQLNETTVTVSQSWLTEWLLCQRRAVLVHQDQLGEETAATAMGRSVHDMIAARLAGLHNLPDPGVYWDLIEAQPKGITLERFVTNAIKLFRTWETQVWPSLPPPAMIECTLERPIGKTCDGRELILCGTVDFMDTEGTIWDWKTTMLPRSRAVERWTTKAETSVQATAYRMLATNEPDTEFFYAVLSLDGVDFHQAPKSNFSVFTELLVSSVNHFIMTDGWVTPNGIGDPLCSPRYCPAWDQCLGAIEPYKGGS